MKFAKQNCVANISLEDDDDTAGDDADDEDECEDSDDDDEKDSFVAWFMVSRLTGWIVCGLLYDQTRDIREIQNNNMLHVCCSFVWAALLNLNLSPESGFCWATVVI